MNAHSPSTAKSDPRHGSATATLTFSTVRAPYLKAGIDGACLLPLIPAKPRLSSLSKVLSRNFGKVPGEYKEASDDWRGLQGPHFREGLTPEFQAKAASWPTRNMGVRGAVYPGIDSDVGTKAARRLVDDVIRANFIDLDGRDFAVRTRGTSTRQLYAFVARGLVASLSNAVVFSLPDDPVGIKPHVVEIKGASNHWVCEGQHPEGEWYEWLDGADLVSCVAEDRLIELGNEDMARLVSELKQAIEAKGGKIHSTASAGSGGGSGELHDYSDDDPIMPVEVILDGLREHFQNTSANIPHHDVKGGGGFVSVLAQIRAALGREADDPETFAEVQAWATAHEDDTGADDAYFVKTWGSLDSGVRVDPWSLDVHFRKVGYHEGARHDFPDEPELAKSVAASNDNYDATVAGKKARLKRRAAAEYAFGLGNTRSSRAEEKKHRVRHVGSTESEEYLTDWWAGKSPNSRTRKFIAELRSIKDWDKDPTAFLTEMVEDHPECIYFGEILDPRHDIGDMVEEKDKHGNTRRRINMRAMPLVQKLGAALPKGSCDNDPDVLNFEKFIKKLFREHAKYELDTIAWMAQSKKRPGNMLILQGDSGTGKTTYVDALSLLFDGPFSTHKISGVTLARQDGLRFALMALIGGRIGQFVEMLDNPPEVVRKILDSLIKQLVDAGSGGDTFEAEGKHVQAGRAKNHVRLVATTNFRDVLNVGAQDRRLFVVVNGITLENRDDDGDWFDKVLLPIVTDEKRLARVWRALLDRDVSKYDPTKPPPQTLGKFELKAIGEQNVYTRIIGLVVPETLKRAGRRFVDADEVWALARAAVHNIYVNTNHDTDHRHLFDERPAVGVTRGAFAKFGLEFPAIKDDLRGTGIDSKKPLPTVYVAKVDHAAMKSMRKPEIMDALEKDRVRALITETSFPPMWAGPITAPAPTSKSKPRAEDDFHDHDWG